MSYTVLARRYRSNTFDDLIGQEHVARTLKRAIESGRIAHAFLFCGTRGTGKTSSARILAKCLNCESSDKPTVKPCLTCNSCVAIARGDDIDVIEIDAASNTGVDNVRDIIENSQYRPARARFKVYIIDEVHMLSKNAFNALLKTLEEPPSHVKFILATTEPEKVLATILSRCQRYDFRNIPTREIAGHLKEICKREKVAIDDDAVLLVAKAGAGSMRDSLSLLDRLLSLGETTVTADMIEQLLGLPKSQVLFDLADAVGRGDTKGTLNQVDAIVNHGLQPDSLIAALVDHLRNLLILATCGADSDLVEVPGLPLADLVAQAERFDAIALSQDIAILEELRRTLRTTQAGRALLDATLVRLALADQFASIDGLISGNGAGPPAQKKKPEQPVSADEARGPVAQQLRPVTTTNAGPPVPPNAAKPQAMPTPTAASAAPAPIAQKPAGGTDDASEPAVDFSNIDLGDDDALPSVGRVWDGPAPSLSTIMSQGRNARALSTAPKPTPAPVTEMSNVEPVVIESLPGTWQALLGLLAQHSQGLHGILSLGKFVGIDDGRAVVKFSSQHDSLVKMLDRNGKKEAVAKAFSQVMRQETGVRFVIDDAVGVPPLPPPGAPGNVLRAVVPLASTAPPLANVTPAFRISPPAPAPAPEPQGIRVTQDMKDALYRDDPLVRAIVDELGGEIVKIEEG